MRPKLLIWDWNGTLLDDMELTYEIENIMLRERGMKQIPSRTFYLANFGFPIIDYYIKLGYDFSIYPYAELAEEFHRLYSETYRKCGLRKGAVETLVSVRAQGIPQTILSASNQRRLIEQTDYYGVSAYFEELLGLPDDFAHSKVERAKDYIARCGIDPCETLLVGDTDHDYQVAREIGAKCVLLTGGHQGKEVLARCDAPVLDSLAEVMDYIRA